MLSGDAFDTAEIEKALSCVAVLRHAEDNLLKGKRRQRAMKNRRKQGKIFRSLLAVLMLTAMLVTSVLQPVFAGDYEAGKTGNLT